MLRNEILYKMKRGDRLISIEKLEARPATIRTYVSNYNAYNKSENYSYRVRTTPLSIEIYKADVNRFVLFDKLEFKESVTKEEYDDLKKVFQVALDEIKEKIGRIVPEKPESNDSTDENYDDFGFGKDSEE